MRNLLIVASVGILGVAAWTVTLDAQSQRHGATSASPAHSGLVVYPRYTEYHFEIIGGLIFPVQTEINPSLFPGQPDLGSADQDMSTGGAFVAGHGPMVGGHQGFGDQHAGPASHAHVVVHGDQAKALFPQVTAPRAAESDQGGAATAQPNPSVAPWSPRPPGAAGPGRRVTGRSGPGLPGPGRRASPRW